MALLRASDRAPPHTFAGARRQRAQRRRRARLERRAGRLGDGHEPQVDGAQEQPRRRGGSARDGGGGARKVRRRPDGREAQGAPRLACQGARRHPRAPGAALRGREAVQGRRGRVRRHRRRRRRRLRRLDGRWRPRRRGSQRPACGARGGGEGPQEARGRVGRARGECGRAAREAGGAPRDGAWAHARVAAAASRLRAPRAVARGRHAHHYVDGDHLEGLQGGDCAAGAQGDAEQRRDRGRLLSSPLGHPARRGAQGGARLPRRLPRRPRHLLPRLSRRSGTSPPHLSKHLSSPPLPAASARRLSARSASPSATCSSCSSRRSSPRGSSR